MNDSPIERLLAAIDGLDLDAVMALVAPDVRAVVLREGPGGIAELRFYGAHEHPVNEHDTGKEWGNLVRDRWIPPV
ncbi:MAG: hypothetical protein ACJ766_07035 [Thermoleophilaceae bacterium]